MRLLYSFIFFLILPFVLLRLYWRGIKAPEYRKRWLERLAFYDQSFPQNVIWIHAVSVGEAEAVFPLVRQLQKQHHLDSLLITTTTPTGSARVKAVFGGSLSHVYLPYDLPWIVKRFIAVFKPKIALIMEKEIWPNLYAECNKNKIPLLIINARLSANSAKGYKKIPGLIKPALASIQWIATQTEEDRQRFIDIGAKESQTWVMGNLKFDLEINEALIEQAIEIKRQLFSNRLIWVIASTHEGEEVLFFECYAQLKQRVPNLLLLVVPRHPERFVAVKQLAEKMQLTVCMRSSGQQCLDNTDVYIADTMGELKLLYGVADICFVGGSMVPVGGHNILEPAAMNIPIMFGPHMINFKEIAKNVLQLDAAAQCTDQDSLATVFMQLHSDVSYRNTLALNAREFINKNQGATKRIAGLIADVLKTAA